MNPTYKELQTELEIITEKNALLEAEMLKLQFMCAYISNHYSVYVMTNETPENELVSPTETLTLRDNIIKEAEDHFIKVSGIFRPSASDDNT